MAAALSVSQIREALLRAHGAADGGGEPSSPLLGTVFHQVLADLLDDGPDGLEALLRDRDPDLVAWQQAAYEHTWDQLLAPRLTHATGTLQTRGEQLLSLQRAMRAAVDWLCEIWWTATEEGTRLADPKDWFWAERSVSYEVRLPDWREAVVVGGIVDAVLKTPDGRWCVIEWKLGKTTPAVDLAQACLYQWLLAESNGTAERSAVSVVGFLPERHELTRSEGELAPARRDLLALIGELAGVTKPRGGDRVPDWVREMGDRLLAALDEAGAPCRMARDAVVGPAFARFFVFPERRVLPKRVMSQADHLHLHLVLSGPPTMEIADGAIAIDLPRPDRLSVQFAGVRPYLPAADPLRGNAQVPIGATLDGDWAFCDLSQPESAHLLVVGSPGSGKSQWLRVAVAALLLTNTPETLQLVLIDPKQNAFGFARRHPAFLRRPIVVPGTDDVAALLAELVDEMVARNATLAKHDAQSLAELTAATGQPAPRVVIVCDEYADLLSGVTRAERGAIEHGFQRLAQVGRAPGFHLVLATQQPRAAILSPAIRSLLPAKVALRVVDALESRVAMDEGGAERLLGKGDLYYKCVGRPRRLQGAWLSAAEEPA